MYLGIEQQSGVVFESSGGFYYPVQPRPIITFATPVDDPSDPSAWGGLPASSQFSSDAKLLLREEQFDPVTRTRRGRLFELSPTGQPSTEHISWNGAKQVSMWKYQHPANLLNGRNWSPLQYLALGTTQFANIWRVVAMEVIGGGDMLVTLRAVELLGVVPDLNAAVVPAQAYNRLNEALQALADNAYRQPPEALVDQCRAVLTIVIGEYVHAREPNKGALTKDLGDLVSLLRQLKPVKDAAASAAQVVARLHARVKPNVQVEHGVKPPSTADAELALQAVGLVLRDFEWARYSGR